MASFEGLGYGLMNDALGFLRSDEGYALPSRYEIEIGQPKPMGVAPASGGGGGLLGMFSKMLPSGLAGMITGAGGGGLRTIQMRAESVQLPGRNLSTADDANIYGPIRTVADGVNFAEDINITFQCGSELGERKFFEAWQETCYERETWNMKYYWDYVGTIKIYLLDVNNKRRYGLACMEAYPKTVGGIDLTYTPASDIAKVTVSFVFRYWKNIDIEDKGPDMLGNMANTVVDVAQRNIMRNLPSSLSF